MLKVMNGNEDTRKEPRFCHFNRLNYILKSYSCLCTDLLLYGVLPRCRIWKFDFGFLAKEIWINYLAPCALQPRHSERLFYLFCLFIGLVQKIKMFWVLLKIKTLIANCRGQLKPKFCVIICYTPNSVKRFKLPFKGSLGKKIVFLMSVPHLKIQVELF